MPVGRQCRDHRAPYWGATAPHLAFAQVVDWTDDRLSPDPYPRHVGGILLLLGGCTCTGRRGQGSADSRPPHRLRPPLRRYCLARRDLGGIRVAVLSATLGVRDEHAGVQETRIDAPSLGPLGTRCAAGPCTGRGGLAETSHRGDGCCSARWAQVRGDHRGLHLSARRMRPSGTRLAGPNCQGARSPKRRRGWRWVK